MKIGVKYCGGCNPTYDRSQILSKLKQTTQQEYVLINKDETYDIVLLLCGCSICCIRNEDYKFKYKKIIIMNEKDYEKSKDLIMEICK